MERVRYGIIGIGGIGALHVDAARGYERIDLAAIVDTDEALVRERSRHLGIPGFTDYRELLAGRLLDAVSIATPHHLHVPIGLDCLSAGLHVYMEKPLSRTLSEADRLIATARTQRRKINVGHQYRVHRSSRTLKNIIESGRIGTVRRVLWTWSKLHTERCRSDDPWRTTWADSGGGILIQNLIHDLDLLCWLVGKPVRVSAVTGNQDHCAETEDVVCCSVVFENGAFATFQGTVNQPAAFNVRQIAGDRGIIVMPDVRSLTFDRKDRILLGTYERPVPELVRASERGTVQPRTSWRRVPLLGDQPPWIKVLQRSGLWRPRPHGITVLLRGFADAILDGGEPPVTAESARTVLELVNAITLSALRGRTVDLPLDPGEYDDLYDELCSGKIAVPRFRTGEFG